jgi:regulator of protease activity HflC (stomatin/prohibitin superfamily)
MKADEQRTKGGDMRKLLYAAVMSIAVLAMTGCGLVGVEDGQAGVKADFGKIGDEAIGTGWHFYVPGITWIEVWNVKIQELKETASVPSSEGLISQLDISILYQIPKDKVTLVRKTIGADYRTNILEPYVREAIRNVASGYEVKALYSDEGRGKIGKQMLEFLKSKLDPKGIYVTDVLLRDVKLPEAFSESIQQKLKTEQEALQKQFELQKAQKDAEITIAKARGVAESNKIIAASLSDNYLRYLWIEGLQRNEKQIIYVPTEANLPIMEAGRAQFNKETKQ